MAQLMSVSTALAEHCVTASDTARDLATTLAPSVAARFIRMVESSGNDTRFLLHPLDQLRRLDTLAARTEEYRQHAVRLGECVARKALQAAGLHSSAIGAIIGVSSTGHLMPTLETHLLDRLRLSPHCRRVPLTQLGCAGGVAGLSLAAALNAAAPADPVLVVSVELPSLSFPTAEPAPSDIVASTQFGDAAAAAIVCAERAERGPALLATGRSVFPGTIDRNEALLTPFGLRLRPTRGLAELLRTGLGKAIDEFLARQGLTRADIDFWAVHPRSPELLDAAAASLDLSDRALAPSRAVWRRCGNVISSAVFHVLRQLADAAPPQREALGMVVAFGTGFACEMILLRADGWLCGRTAAHAAAGDAMRAAHASMA